MNFNSALFYLFYTLFFIDIFIACVAFYFILYFPISLTDVFFPAKRMINILGGMVINNVYFFIHLNECFVFAGIFLGWWE